MLCAEGGFNELDQISVPGAKAVTVGWFKERSHSSRVILLTRV